MIDDSVRRRRPTRCVAIAALILVFAGCGNGGVYPVQGQIVWKDGSPANELAGTLVFFEQPEKQLSARGQVAADGSFRLTTNKENDGAAAGEHIVLLVEIGRKQLGGPDLTLLAPGKIDSRYSTHSTSDLKATVKPGTNRITLTVEPPK
jgi:hypothetical protein